MNEATRTRAVADTNYLYAHAAEVNAAVELIRRAAEALQTLEDRLTFFPEIDPEDECVSEEARAHLARIIEGLDAIRNSGYVPLHTVADTVRYIADLLER